MSDIHEYERWKEFSKGYKDKVFSLTEFPYYVNRMVHEIPDKYCSVLNVGTGPTINLNRSLVEAEHSVVAMDFCQDMLDVAEEQFFHNDVRYELGDMTNIPFNEDTFDVVVSTNSILPPQRLDVVNTIFEIHRVLKEGGVFIGFLCSFVSALNCIELGVNTEADHMQSRVMDTGGWQCFHTRKTIESEFHMFKDLNIEIVALDGGAEQRAIQEIYGIGTHDIPVYEYLAKATK